MESHKNAADRMRPILQAMERSIDAARRNRTHKPTSPAQANLPASAPAPAPPVRVRPESAAPASSEEGTPRLKARPKRLDSPYSEPYGSLDYRSQAS